MFFGLEDEKKYRKTSVIETINSGISQIQIYLDTIKYGRTEVRIVLFDISLQRFR